MPITARTETATPTMTQSRILAANRLPTLGDQEMDQYSAGHRNREHVTSEDRQDPLGGQTGKDHELRNVGPRPGDRQRDDGAYPDSRGPQGRRR